MGSCWGKVRERMGWGGKGIEGRGLTGTMMTIYITPVRSSRKPQKGTAVLPGGRQKRCPASGIVKPLSVKQNLLIMNLFDQ